MPIVISRRNKPAVLKPKGPGSTLIRGMGGMGDNLHQRAVVRALMREGVVELETPWPAVYHDLAGPQLRLLRMATNLRTQRKNMAREAAQFVSPGRHTKSINIWYSKDGIIEHGSVLGAMCAAARVTERDFSMPVPVAWQEDARRVLANYFGWDGMAPLVVYRPLISRTEWGGCAARNPDVDAYDAIFAAAREHLFVVSVADLVPGTEWAVSHPIKADATFHKGELTFELLAGVMRMASLSYASPGFATILAQAVGTPSICVFGGYENSTSFAGGAHLAPYLGIDPIEPCICFQHQHACKKQIDVPRAIARVYQFVEQHCHDHDDPALRPAGEAAQADHPQGGGQANPGQLELPL